MVPPLSPYIIFSSFYSQQLDQTSKQPASNPLPAHLAYRHGISLENATLARLTLLSIIHRCRNYRLRERRWENSLVVTSSHVKCQRQSRIVHQPFCHIKPHQLLWTTRISLSNQKVRHHDHIQSSTPRRRIHYPSHCLNPCRHPPHKPPDTVPCPTFPHINPLNTTKLPILTR